MVKLKVSEDLSGPQKATGTIEAVEGPKLITPKGTPKEKVKENSFHVLEFTIGNIQGPLRNVLGNRTLKVSYPCDLFTPRSHLGKLAATLFGWDGQSEPDTDSFKTCNVEFVAELQTRDAGDFWEINRNTVGAIGHIQDGNAIPTPTTTTPPVPASP